jgi:hypothetical protein
LPRDTILGSNGVSSIAESEESVECSQHDDNASTADDSVEGTERQAVQLEMKIYQYLSGKDSGDHRAYELRERHR